MIPIEWQPTFGAVSLILMALFPIVAGAYRSLQVVKKSKDKGSHRPEVLTPKSAAMYPVYASCVLVGFYVFTKVVPNEYKNLAILLGLLLIAGYERFIKKDDDTQLSKRKLSLCEKIFLGFCVIFVLTNQHTWVSNNMIAIVFSVIAIEELCLENVFTGCILQGGLLIYDIFWVFATNVMLTVADIQNLPLKIVFPVDIFDNGLAANKFMMLGLGDIVVPAFFISLLFRFDNHLNRRSQTYFITGVIAFILGLWVAFYVATTYRCAQPALLYLVPACIGAPLLVAWIKGDMEALFQYSDFPCGIKNTKNLQISEEREKTE